MNTPQEAIGRRIAAALVDLVVILVLLVLVGIVTGESYSHGSSAGVNLRGGGAVLWIVLSFGYYFVLELQFGRTLGKSLFGLAVTRTDGAPLTAGPVLVRTILRIVDILPLLYLVGFVAMIATGPKAARLGDLAAGTSVVQP